MMCLLDGSGRGAYWSTCQNLDKSVGRGLHEAMTNPTSTADLGPYQPYLEAALAACDGASQILCNHFGNLRNVDEKFQAGLVSEADRNSEKFIVDLLRSRFPQHDILGEESGLNEAAETARNGAQSKGSLWMIDPLDGTTNYVHQFPFFCISIGLEVDGEMVVGVVDAPMLKLRYQAVKGGGAFLNGQPIHVSPRKEFKDALFATGFSTAYDETLDEQFKLATKTIRDGRGIRRAGAAALDLCFVAQGVFDSFWEKKLQPWDTAAGSIIVKEAGGLVTDMEGGVFNPRSKSVLAGSPAMHAQVLNAIREIRQGG